MLLYKGTFENIKTVGYNFPVEDQYYANDNEAIVADGVTRDPIGKKDFSKYSKKELLESYPSPSGGELAAIEICKSFSETTGALVDRLVSANESVRKLNEEKNPICDYLENDYYCAVASCISIEKDTLYYSYICDCGVIVYDSFGDVKFKTEDDKELYSDPYIDNIGTPWYLPETRVKVRKEFRNNPDNIVDGKCVSYGALTGEQTALPFIRSGQVKLDSGDTIMVYSDGFSYYLNDRDFIKHITDFNEQELENYVEEKAALDADKYGKERTLVIFKH